MLSAQEAIAAILAETPQFSPSRLRLEDGLGLVLAEDIYSDIDSPPFDKALMDGFAVRAADVASGSARLTLIGEVTAGRVAEQRLQPGGAVRIMTGAPLPAGADAVLRQEEAELESDGQTVRMEAGPLQPGANLMRRATAMARGETVLAAGHQLRPQDLALLAELGRETVPVHRKPQVAVLATGDELVPVGETPGDGQIRNSNEPMLVAQIRRAGAAATALGIARDERNELAEKIAAGLGGDVLLLSGGVSAGKLDLVPAQLQAAGVREIFHKVNVKPGKPLWFGVADGGSPSQRRLVFGLPGNPVSSMVCFELFARTALRRLMGFHPAEPQSISARLTVGHSSRGNRPTYFPAHWQCTETGPTVRPVDWQGSADLRATVEANAMALFPAGATTYQPGDRVEVYPWS